MTKWGLGDDERRKVVWESAADDPNQGILKRIVRATLRHVCEELEKHQDLNVYGKQPGYIYYALSLEERAELKEEAGL